MADRIVKQGQRIMVRGRAASGQKYTALPDVYLDEGESVLVSFPAPPPPIRVVQPGEDIAAAVANDRKVILAPGAHNSFVLNGITDADITFADGASISGAVRAVEIVGGFGVLRDVNVTGNGCGVQFRGECDWEIVGGQVFSNTKMIRNDVTPTNNDYGAMGFAFDDVSGRAWVHDVEVAHNRVDKNAPSYDYGLNEGSAFELWKSSGVVIEDCVVFDNQVVIETGTNDPAKQCSFTFKGNTVWNGKTDATRLSKGLLLRTATNSLVEHNVLDGLDEWAINIAGGGNFGGSVQGLTIRDNVAWTPAALIRTGSGVSGTWSFDHNAVSGSMVWGSVPAHGPAEADPFVGRAVHNYTLKTGSALLGAAHDGSDIGP